jgi:3-phosphoshikimate 1-carboxyvinyltransferase
MDAAMAVTLEIVAPRRLRGRVQLPGDKSISHRYAILGALARGHTRIHGYAPGADCTSTLACLAQLGAAVERQKSDVLVHGCGLRGLSAPPGPLDAGNSGTTMRLLAGALAAHPFEATLDGDASLRRRPMRRVIEPLERMGARIGSADGHAPLVVSGTRLLGIEYTPAVPSAQVKSAVLLAGLQAEGTTVVREGVPTRDHTERALAAFAAPPARAADSVAVTGGVELTGTEVRVPGDFSSLAFLAVAAAAVPGSDLTFIDVGLNPTRTALLDVLRRAGARVEAEVEREAAFEPAGRVRVRHDGLGPLTISPPEVPALIDELPALAAMAAAGRSELHVTGAAELRVKESDRIAALVAGLRALGAEADELPDGFHVGGGAPLRGGAVHAAGDHRLAMAFAIAALGASGPTTILGGEAVGVSFPGFFEMLCSVCE